MNQIKIQDEQKIMCENNQEKKETNSGKEVVKKPLFTNKCKWIAFSIISVLILGGIAAGVVVAVVKSQKKSSVATLVINQRDDYTQQDEICVQHTTQNLTNCTQIQINTTRVTVDTNEVNATSLVILQGLRLSQFQEAADGTRSYSDITEENNQIEAQIKNLLRILQQSDDDNDNDFCYGIEKSECGDINQVPILSVVTNQLTGNVESIGVPSGVPDLALQPLVSNIVHIAPNVEEANNQTTPGNGRILIENSYYSNLYYIGKSAFLPSFEKTKGDDDSTIIKKSISLSQWMNNNQNGGIGFNILDRFDQLQESVFDKNNFLVSSHIRTYSLIDSTIQSSDPNDVTQQSQTEINSDSNLITVQTRSDQDLTNALQEIKSKQKVNYYTPQDIQTKIVNNKNGQQQDSEENQDYQEENNISSNNQETADAASQNTDGNNRILEEENGDVRTYGDIFFVSEQSECYDTKFTEKRNLKEVTVLKQKIAIQSEFSGQTTGKDASGYIQTCITLNDFCLYLLQRDDFAFNGPKIKDLLKEESQTSSLFSTTIILLGYPVQLGADISYSWSFKQSNIDTKNEKGIQESVSAQLSVIAYGEINILALIKIQAGVSGNIFKGSLVGAIRFGFDDQKGLIQFNRYLISIDFQLEVLTIDLYARFSTVEIRFEKRCVGRKWWRICIWLPIPEDSEWKDIYRVSFEIVKVVEVKRLFQRKSKCY